MSLNIEQKIAGAAGTEGKFTTDELNKVVALLDAAMGDNTGPNGLKDAIDKSDTPYVRIDKTSNVNNTEYTAKDLELYTNDNNAIAYLPELKGKIFLNITAFTDVANENTCTVSSIVVPGDTNKTLISTTTYTLIEGMSNIIYADFDNNTFKLVTDVASKVLNPKLDSIGIDGKFSISVAQDSLNNDYIELKTSGNNGFVITDVALKFGTRDVLPGTYLLTNDVVGERFITMLDKPMLGDSSVSTSGMKSYIIPDNVLDTNGISVDAGPAREIIIDDMSIVYTEKDIYIKNAAGEYIYTGDSTAVGYLYKDSDFEMTFTTVGLTAIKFQGTGMLLDGQPYISQTPIPDAGTYTIKGVNITQCDTDYDNFTDIHVERNSKQTNAVDMFAFLTNLTTFTAGPDTFGSVTNFDRTWFGCKNLTNMPMIDTSSGVYFLGTWTLCYSLTSFPAIDTSSADVFRSTWAGCTLLTSFPMIDVSNATTLDRYPDGFVDTLPTNYDAYDKTLIETSGTWGACESLVTFPAIDTSSVTSMWDTWKYCYKLVTFPSISLESLSTGIAIWNRCYSLECIGSLVRNANSPALTELSIFENCYNLQNPNTAAQTSISAGNNWVNPVTCPANPVENDFIVRFYTTGDVNATFTGASMKLNGVSYVSGTDIPAANSYTLTGKDITAARFNNNGFISLAVISNNKQTDASIMFSGLNNMTGFYARKHTFGNVYYMDGTWDSCSSLTSFPAIDTSSVTYMDSTWDACSSLTSFPAIDTSSVTYMYATWGSCSSLTSFPDIDTSSVTYMYGTWRECSSLTSFPDIDTSNVTNMIITWDSCSSLTSFPAIDTSNVTIMSGTWNACSSLTSFPAIDTSNVTYMYATWNACSSLTSFPLVDFTKVTSTYITFSDCTALVCMGGIIRDNPVAYIDSDGMLTNTPALLYPNATEQASILAGNQWINPNAC